jgi:hypothetical protein
MKKIIIALHSSYASCLEQSRSSSDSVIALYDGPFLEEE